MSEPVYGALDREQAAAYLGTHLPPTPGAPCLRVTEVEHGYAAVYPDPGRPGTSWWVIDGLIYPQDAGAPGELLAALLPGSALETVPAPAPESPPPMSPPSGPAPAP